MDGKSHRPVGIVVAVHGNGSIETVDGNYDNRGAQVGPYFPESAETYEPGNVYALCYGTGWDTTEKYAPDKEASMGSIADPRAILDQLVPEHC